MHLRADIELRELIQDMNAEGVVHCGYTLFVAVKLAPYSRSMLIPSGDCMMWSGVLPCSSTTMEASHDFQSSKDCKVFEFNLGLCVLRT